MNQVIRWAVLFRSGRRRRSDAGPEIVEFDGVEEGRGADDPARPHVEEPGIGVGIGLTVLGDPSSVEENEPGAVGTNAD